MGDDYDHALEPELKGKVKRGMIAGEIRMALDVMWNSNPRQVLDSLQKF